MAKCVLDLTDVGSYGNLGGAYGTYQAESILIDSIAQLELFRYNALERVPGVLPWPAITEIVVEDTELYPNNRNGEEVVSIFDFIDSLRDPINPQILKKRSSESVGIFLTELITPVGLSAYPDGRINLNIVGGDPCKKGFYGLIADKFLEKIPVYEICYVPRTIAYSTLPRTTIARAKRVSDLTTESFVNRRGPLVISDEISIRSGKGISIMDDLVACPPVDPGIFFATDIDFGEIESGVVDIKDVLLYNRTSPTPPNTGEITLLDITPKEHPNFKILDFNHGGGFSQLTKSPLDLSSNPLIMPAVPNSPFSFGVQYDPKDDLGVTHQMEITYSVETKTNKPEVVTQEKITTKLTGIGYNVNVTCSDANWGQVDVFNLDNRKEITIQNTGTKDVYLYDYQLTSKTNGNFLLISKLNVSKKNPIRLQPNEIYPIVVNYNPNGIVGTEHTAQIRFYFAYDHPKQGILSGEVKGTKLTSYLSGIGYSDPIDDVIDDVTGVVTDDDNGVFVTKVLSVILDKSVTVQKNRTFPLWNCVGDRLFEIYTGSNGQKMDKYYLPIYNKPVGEHGSHHQFDISYGHVNGSGSSYYDGNNLIELSPSKAMYRKYLIECYGNISGSGNIPKKFKFRNNVESDSVYFIQLDRDDYKDMLDPGNFEISLVPMSSSINQLYNTGSNCYVNTSSSIVYKLIDNSSDTKQDRTDRSGLDSFYYIVSGSIQQGIYDDDNSNAWGMVFPKMGLIILDGNVLDQSCSFNTVTASIDGDNIYKLFLSLSGSMTISDARPASESMYARSAEKSLIQTYFCRANPDEFNYSNNPTFTSGSLNTVKYQYFIKEPRTYITSIGLYNKKNELVAVGKLKKPLLKTDKTQYVFQVRVRIM